MKTTHLLAVLMVLLISGCSISTTQSSSEIGTTFFKPYTIAVSNILVAEKVMNAALFNEDYGWNDLFYYNDNASSNYYQARDYLSTSSDQVSEAKSLLNKALLKLNTISSLAPDEFYRQDINLRTNLTNILISQYTVKANMVELRYDVLYSWWNDNATVFNATWDAYVDEYNNNLLLQYNSYLEDSNTVREDIDLLWDQNWYNI